MAQNPYDPYRRQTHYEAFEPRLVLSAQGWDQLVQALPSAAAAVEGQLVASAQPSSAAEQLRSDLEYLRQRYALRGQGQTVAIVDSGIAYDHVALGGGFGPGFRVVGGRDFTEENDGDPFDDPPAGFHGTHVAGVIGSADAQFPGVAPQVDLVALRVLNDAGVGRLEWVEQALDWIHEHRESFEHPITTVNLSVGAALTSDTAAHAVLEDELAQLEADGIFIAVAAGNSFDGQTALELTYPAASQHVVPVASLADDGQFSAFSQRDARVLAVPGERVTSTVPRHVFGGGAVANDFSHAHGTSMATPYVAGAGVLVREAMQRAGYDSIDQDRIETHLRETADPFYDAATDQTYLRMNLRRAIDTLLAEPIPASADAGQTVTLDDRTLYVSAAADTNTVEVELGVGLRVVVNGDVYEFDRGQVDRVQIRGQGSFDTALVHGSESDETVRAFPDRLEMAGGPVDVTVSGFQRIEVRAGGGDDVANLYDSPGGDRLYAYPDYAVLTGVAYRHQVVGFDRVLAYAQAGGYDEARFYDSSHNDRFYARPDHWTMSGMGYQNRASGFDRVEAYATLGGDDRAVLYDTSGDDRFHGRATAASIGNAVLQTHVHGFDRVTAHAVSGGSDQAYFHDSPGADRFDAQPTGASLSGLGYHHLARGFDLVHAQSGRGPDTAELHGAFTGDLLLTAADRTDLRGAGYQLVAERFADVRVYGGGGDDRATLLDVATDDPFDDGAGGIRIRDAAGSRAIHDFVEIVLGSDRAQAESAAVQTVFRAAGR
jgi:subtilisin family serine protease